LTVLIFIQKNVIWIAIGITLIVGPMAFVEFFYPGFFANIPLWIQIGPEENSKDFKWSKSESMKFEDNIETKIGKLGSIESFRFTKANNKDWILIPSVEPALLRNSIALPNEKEVFELKNKDFIQSREKRIEIVIFEPNLDSVKENINWLITIYKQAGADLLEPNYDNGPYKADVFYQTKCNIDEAFDLSKCTRRGLIDVYKEDDRLFVIHTWIERNERDIRSPLISTDVIDIMKSFAITKN